jgi:hypothetical protein
MKKTLKIALDALELVNIEFVCNGAHHTKKDRHELWDECPITVRYQKAITAIKEELAKIEQDDKCREALNRLAEENKRLGLEY